MHVVDQMRHFRSYSHKRVFNFCGLGLEVLQQEGIINGQHPRECFLVKFQEPTIISTDATITFHDLVNQVAEFDFFEIILQSHS